MQLHDLGVKRFESNARYWETIYEDKSVYASIHQLRMELALSWISELRLPAGNRVLEAGCGAGLMTVALAQRGHWVDALDASVAMLDLTRCSLERAGLQSQANTILGDVHRLHFQDDTFHLVLALGVIPWLHSPDKAIQEMVRVLKPGGYLLVNTDNFWRLHHLLDPKLNPFLAPLRRMISKGLGRTSSHRTLYRMQSPRQFDQFLAEAGARKLKGITFGFGPFSFFTRPLVKDSTGIKLHNKLQSFADRRIAVLRSTGAQYLVLAKKSHEEAA